MPKALAEGKRDFSFSLGYGQFFGLKYDRPWASLIENGMVQHLHYGKGRLKNSGTKNCGSCELGGDSLLSVLTFKS